MSRSRARAALLAPIAFAILGAGLVRQAPAEDPIPVGNGPAAAPDVLPFADLVARVHVGEPVHVGSLAVLPLWATPDPQRPAGSAKGPLAWVGLAGTDAVLLDLPLPVGFGVVRVTNALPAPLLLPRGEALLPPAGAARIVDRPVWIPGATSAFVPVAQATDDAAAGPYQPSVERASPAMLRALRRESFAEFVRESNLALGVAADRILDPVAGFATPAFLARGDAFLEILGRLRESVPAPPVGLAIVDGGGLSTILLEGDPARFRALWPAWARGIALDAVVRERRGIGAIPKDVPAKAYEQTLAALRELRAEPTSRPAFGEGLQVRWPATSDVARWYGLVVEGAAIEATFHRPTDPVPGGPPAPPPPAPPREPPPPHIPGATELERKTHPTPFEERLRERREAAMGGG